MRPHDFSPSPIIGSRGLRPGPCDGPRLLAHPGGKPLYSWPSGRRGGEAIVAIGPEGGFTDSEAEAARSSGWVSVGLGPTLLRIETAGLVVCSNLLALAEGWEV
ncbi:RsmE family RNA methyltransferase [Singulisphaera rosea]